MFHNSTKSAKTAVAASRLKVILAAGVAAVSLAALATPASATNIFLDKGEMFTPAKATISGPAYTTVTAWDGPVLFTANYGTTASANTFTFLGFCVDVFDAININVTSPATPTTLNLAYHDGALVNNGEHATGAQAADFVTLTQLQKDDISRLVNWGTSLWNTDSLTDPTHQNMSNTLINQLGGIQGAIWKIENPTFTVVGATSPYGGANNATTVTNLINSYTNQTFLNTLAIGHMNTVFDSNQPLHQAFAFAATVPEPSTWAMMILGMGGVGAALRRRRAQAAFA